MSKTTLGVGSLLLVLLLTACGDQGRVSTADLRELRIGVPLQPASALLHLALENGDFERHGLRVNATFYPSGKRALSEGLANGRVDVCAAAAVPFVAELLKGLPLASFSSIYSADNVNRIVARNDAGVRSIEDLNGKRLATQAYSAVHYFADLVLKAHHMANGQVELVFRKAEDLVQGLAAGDYEAISMREPYVSEAVRLLQGRAQVFAATGLYRQFELLVYRRDNPPDERAMRAMVAALLDAESFARAQPEQAIRIVARRLGGDIDEVRSAWRVISLRVQLEQSLLSSIDAIAAWASNGAATDLDVLGAVNTGVLKSLNPVRVSIIE